MGNPARRTGLSTTTGGASGLKVEWENGKDGGLYVNVDDVWNEPPNAFGLGAMGKQSSRGQPHVKRGAKYDPWQGQWFEGRMGGWERRWVIC